MAVTPASTAVGPAASSKVSAPKAGKGGRAAKSLVQEGVELALCAGAIYLCFLGYGLLHERLYKRRYGDEGERFTHSLFLVACQSVGNCAFAAVLLSVMRQPANTVPFFDYVQIAFSYIGAMYSSNLALNYMSYPAQSLAKSCKLIPVMLMRIVVLRKVYALHEYVQVGLITAGICVFMLFEDGAKGGGKEATTSLLGFGLCLLSLALDGFTGPTQERINAQHRPSMAQMMFFLNVWAVALCLVLLVATQQLWSGLAFFSKYPEVLPEVAVFSLLSALGQAAILVTVLRFNSLVLTTITTTRKLFTILFSVFLHGHALNVTQWSGVAMVFAGLGLEVLDKYRAKQKHGKGPTAKEPKHAA